MQYKVSSFDALMKNIAENMTSSGSLLMQYPATYICYLLFSKILLKKEQMLPILEKLSKGVRTGKDLRISHLDGQVQDGP